MCTESPGSALDLSLGLGLRCARLGRVEGVHAAALGARHGIKHHVEQGGLAAGQRGAQRSLSGRAAGVAEVREVRARGLCEHVCGTCMCLELCMHAVLGLQHSCASPQITQADETNLQLLSRRHLYAAAAKGFCQQVVASLRHKRGRGRVGRPAPCGQACSSRRGGQGVGGVKKTRSSHTNTHISSRRRGRRRQLPGPCTARRCTCRPCPRPNCKRTLLRRLAQRRLAPVPPVDAAVVHHKDAHRQVIPARRCRQRQGKGRTARHPDV